MTYEEALAEVKRVGVSQASDAAFMASLCDSVIQTLVGAVAPKLVWEGAKKEGLDAKELMHLASTDPGAVEELQWL